MDASPRKVLLDPLVDNNPITLQMLGVCSALAVTTNLLNSLIMSAALTVVCVFSNGAVSAIRNHMPASIRIIVQMTIIASLVIVVDQLLQAFAFEVSRTLSVFVGLIITNCIVLGRAEAFASKNPVGLSLLDGLGNGLGYSCRADHCRCGARAVWRRQPAGLCHSESGAGRRVVRAERLLLLPPSAFFIIGLMIWGIRTWKRDQVEPEEFQIHAIHRQEVL